jgi:hypothetical protein
MLQVLGNPIGTIMKMVQKICLIQGVKGNKSGLIRQFNVAATGKSCTCPRVQSRAKVPINMNSVIFLLTVRGMECVGLCVCFCLIIPPSF